MSPHKVGPQCAFGACDARSQWQQRRQQQQPRCVFDHDDSSRCRLRVCHTSLPGYCCTLTANDNYKIEFESFRIRDMDSGVQLFEVAKDPDQPEIDVALIPVEMEDQVRCISYDFGEDFLKLKSIGTTCARHPAGRLPATLPATPEKRS